MASPLDFVKQLEIAAPEKEDLERIRSLQALGVVDEEQGLVDAGSLVSFTGEISVMHRSDVLNSTLLAQLAADNKYDRLKDTESWYNYYVSVLVSVGWVIQDFKFGPYSPSGESLQISKAIINILQSILSDSDIAVVKKTVDALQSTGNQSWWKVFDHESCDSSKNGNFQVALSKESSGQVVMGLACVYFTAKSAQDRWFWFSYGSSNISLFSETQEVTLNEDMYSTVRQEVIDKLGDNIKKFIGDLHI